MNLIALLPTEIKLHQQSKSLELIYADKSRYQLPYEYLRVYSPSAEVRGHGQGEMQLVVGKQHVGVKRVEPVGHYAIKIFFDDEHSSGLYTWEMLYELATHYQEYWQNYLKRLKSAGLSRNAY
ncbi:MAG: DUF971 domain-containing protein [Gammaproteobacteria bacterium]